MVDGLRNFRCSGFFEFELVFEFVLVQLIVQQFQ
jgi:hypothetical protein